MALACLPQRQHSGLKTFPVSMRGAFVAYRPPVQPSLNCLCPASPADTSYNGDIDVLLRNPWVRIKEMLAAQEGGGIASKQASECVSVCVCELRIMFSFCNPSVFVCVSTAAVAALFGPDV